jgi:hypothetical protein
MIYAYENVHGVYFNNNLNYNYHIWEKYGLDGESDKIFIYFELFNEVLVGATVTFIYTLVRGFYRQGEQPQYAYSNQNISFTLKKDKHFPWCGVVSYEDGWEGDHIFITNVSGAEPDFTANIPIGYGGDTWYVSYGGSIRFKSITNVSH